MIVAEPAASRGDVQLEDLILGGVHRCVVDGEFGLRDASCCEEAAPCREVVALTAVGPGRSEVEITQMEP